MSERRVRLGFFSYLDGADAARVYQDVSGLFLAADRHGFDVGWVAQHHFGHHGGLPSPFVFFSALAAKTESLGFGTAIISLPLENAVRVAEDAAVFETLFPGRLDLGVGTGFATAPVLETFERAGGDRRALYDGSIGRLLESFEGVGLNSAGDRLHPAAPALRARIWEAPSTLERVAESAKRGSGLLLSRIAIGGGSTPTPQIQIPMVDLYKHTLPAGVAPRIGFSRTVYPTRNPDEAYANLTTGLRQLESARIATGQPPDNRSIDEQIAANNIHWGRPEDVIASLQREPLIGEITDLICQVSPGVLTQEQTLEAIELLATEVAPALGWRPARSLAGVA
jgi:alkanesulfonate monooxygenase SsuD/methylene tetrahydromethanopterin reductase-like flavin-dependent oxidoreductase (luciferase family)